MKQYISGLIGTQPEHTHNVYVHQHQPTTEHVIPILSLVAVNQKHGLTLLTARYTVDDSHPTVRCFFPALRNLFILHL